MANDKKENISKKEVKSEKAKKSNASEVKEKSDKKEKAKAEKAKKPKKEKKPKNPKKSNKKDIKNDKKSKNTAKKPGPVSSLKRLGGMLFAKMAKGGAAELRSNAEEVNQLNVFPVPDGDTGDNMRMTIESGIKAIEGLDTDDLAEVMKVLSHGMLIGARGNSGVILSQFFAGVASGFENCTEATPKILGEALELGVKQAYSTVMTPTEGTILTVAREAVEYAVSKITPQTTIRSFFSNFVGEMQASVERTPELLPALKEAGVVDSGGAGLFYIMDGFNRVLNGEEISPDTNSEEKNQSKETVIPSGFGPDSIMTYGYCTELLVQLQNSKCDIDAFDIDALRAFLSELGDSIVAFKTDSIIKLHVHTLTPEKVLAHMRTFGEFLTVKIENMSMQHTNLEENGSESEKEKPPAEDALGLFSKKKDTSDTILTKKYGVVAVSNGAGIDALFKELGADQTIWGGQTNNPSAGDFLEAFDKIYAENIFVFPNNGNIFLAASQAAGIYEKANVYVIPTKSIGTGYVALATMDFESETPEEIIEAANIAVESVICGYISPAIRDTQMNGVDVKNGDTIGIVGKEIVISCADKLDAAEALAAKLLGTDRFMLSVFFGKDATAEECVLLVDRLNQNHPDVEIYTIDAGQEIYPYVFVAE